MSDISLERCPFCGGEAKLIGDRPDNYAWIRCTKCHASIDTRIGEGHAASLWNRRAAPPADERDKYADALAQVWRLLERGADPGMAIEVAANALGLNEPPADEREALDVQFDWPKDIDLANLRGHAPVEVVEREALADALREYQEALMDMVSQHCDVSTSPDELIQTHFFLSANEHAFDLLERDGLIRCIGQETYQLQWDALRGSDA